MPPDMDPHPAPDIQFQKLRAPLDALAAHELEGAGEADGSDSSDTEDPDDVGGTERPEALEASAEPATPADVGGVPADVAEVSADVAEPEEPFIPLGSEDPPEAQDAPPEDFVGAHAAIARSLHTSSGLPRVLSKEARAFFDGAVYAYTEGDLPGARLSFLAVAAIGDPDTAPAALVFLGVIAVRRRDTPEARMWFTRAAAGPDAHWALVAAGELRRLG